jgi:hypothetical protein
MTASYWGVMDGQIYDNNIFAPVVALPNENRFGCINESNSFPDVEGAIVLVQRGGPTTCNFYRKGKSTRWKRVKGGTSW